LRQKRRDKGTFDGGAELPSRKEGNGMPRFFINFLRGGKVSKDVEGQVLPSLEEAGAAALVSAREIVAENIKSDSGLPLEAVIVTNESGRELMRIPAKSVLPGSLK
jgi:hypothetical protein